jgi:integrase
MANEIDYNQLLEVMARTEIRWNDRGHQYVAELKNKTAWFPVVIALAWLTGGRISEILQLRGKDFKTETQDGIEYVVITLTNLKQRKPAIKEVIVVPAQYQIAWSYVTRYLQSLENPNGLLFHRSRKTVWAICQKELGIGTHMAGRHSFVMAQARRGAQILDVRSAAGWASLDSMRPYLSAFGRKELAKRTINLKGED